MVKQIVSSLSVKYRNGTKFYNYAFYSSVIDYITVEYMDGEVIAITSDVFRDIRAD